MELGGGQIMLATPTPEYEGPRKHREHCERANRWSEVPWVIDGVLVLVDDVAAHFARAEREGARILSPLEPGPPALFTASAVARIAGFALLSLGALLQILAVTALRHRAAAPSVHDTLVRRGPYSWIRHPIYAGALLEFPATVLLQPRLAVLIARLFGMGWAVLQARLEEVDVLQRLPEYRDYMTQVPRFFPAVGRG